MDSNSTWRNEIKEVVEKGKQNFSEVEKYLNTAKATTCEVFGEDINDFVPCQERNVAKHFDTFGIGIFATCESGNTTVIESELKGQSWRYKDKICQSYVKNNGITDEKILCELIISCGKLKKKLIANCIKFKRVHVLDSLLKLAWNDPQGIDLVISFLHGCSTNVIAEELEKTQILNHPKLNWSSLCRYHSDLVIELLRSDLVNLDSEIEGEEIGLKIQELWSVWHDRMGAIPFNQLIAVNGICKKLMDICVQFPLYHEHRSFNCREYTLPSVIKTHLIKQCPEEVAIYFKSHINVYDDGSIGGVVSHILHDYLTTPRISLAHKIDLVEYILTKCTYLCHTNRVWLRYT
jgi:hypothetical protein